MKANISDTVRLYESAGFSPKETNQLLQHQFQSGTLSDEFISILLTHIQQKETPKDTDFAQQEEQKQVNARLAKIIEAVTKNKAFDVGSVLAAMDTLPPRIQLALIQAGHQRFFIDSAFLYR